MWTVSLVSAAIISFHSGCSNGGVWSVPTTADIDWTKWERLETGDVNGKQWHVHIIFGSHALPTHFTQNRSNITPNWVNYYLAKKTKKKTINFHRLRWNCVVLLILFRPSKLNPRVDPCPKTPPRKTRQPPSTKFSSRRHHPLVLLLLLQKRTQPKTPGGVCE